MARRPACANWTTTDAVFGTRASSISDKPADSAESRISSIPQDTPHRLADSVGISRTALFGSGLALAVRTATQ